VSDALLALLFALAAAVSLTTSWILVSRIERIGARLQMPEGVLGMAAALAADAPEVTAAITALAASQATVGAGVVLGSNVFNLAALLGLAALAAGRIGLHRRVISLEGVVALWVAAVALLMATGTVSPAVGLVLLLVVLVPYVAVPAIQNRPQRPSHLAKVARWLKAAIAEEEAELEGAIHPRPANARDYVEAITALVVVVGASVAMEQLMAKLGTRHGISEIVVGGLILAAVTSLPNAVAAIYLARRGRGSATLSTALNSNALNVTVGLAAPAIIAGLGRPTHATTLVAACYLGLTALSLAAAFTGRGVDRIRGAAIVCGYLAFVVAVLSTA
jgi:cation:H+ antiporter